jgi:outer membrane protein assembly factor BamB
MSGRFRLGALLVAASTLTAGAGRAGNWSQWRGPERDGVVHGLSLPTHWPVALVRQWHVTVGEGHSSPVVAGDRVYVFSREGDREVARALELDSGKQLWRSDYPAPYLVNPAARAHGKGPKSTPLVHAGKLYTLGIGGTLSCFDADTGRLRWRKDFTGQFPYTSPLYGTAMSPLIEGGALIIHAGGHNEGALTAFDPDTGDIRWQNRVNGPGYSSPVVATLAGVRQIITQTQSYLLGVDAANGQLLWKERFRTGDQNSVTPVVVGDLLVYSGFNQPLRAIRLKKTGDQLALEEVWANRAHSCFMSTPVLAGGRLFGMSNRSGGHVFSVDTHSGKTIWKSPGKLADNVALLVAGDVVLLLNDQGRLAVLKADASAYQPLAEYQVAESPTWAHPCPAGNRLLIKDKTTLAAWGLPTDS